MHILIALDNLLSQLPSRKNKRLKEELRAVLSQKRRMLPPEEVAQSSAAVVEKIMALPSFQTAQTIMIYYPVHNEIDLRSLLTLAPDKQYLLPVTHRKSIEVRTYNAQTPMKKGRYHIPEPQSEEYKGKIDMILVPGVAFDHQMNRMGRGGGYYDRFLKQFKSAIKIGVGHVFQYVPRVPHTWRDVKMDKVITPSKHTK